MGMEIDYYVKVENEDIDTVLDALLELEGSFYKLNSYNVLHASLGTWFERDKVFVLLSKQFPKALITVDEYPEELYFNGITRAYYCNGDMQEVDAEIVFPKCTLIPPKTELRTVYVTIAGVDIPVEVEVLAGVSEEEIYKLAKQQLKNLL